ncbi:hypothetical protein Scep_019867 [Stephania cephalantha]|uniref:Uncharacterized protein n=1 Tax=Stephania cephalantha TaxID=152367 RepID=A0AAP0IBP9_9MAGN
MFGKGLLDPFCFVPNGKGKCQMIELQCNGMNCGKGSYRPNIPDKPVMCFDVVLSLELHDVPNPLIHSKLDKGFNDIANLLAEASQIPTYGYILGRKDKLVIVLVAPIAFGWREFHTRVLLYEALDRAFNVFCNENVGNILSAKMLAANCHDILKRGREELVKENNKDTFKGGIRYLEAKRVLFYWLIVAICFFKCFVDVLAYGLKLIIGFSSCCHRTVHLSCHRSYSVGFLQDTINLSEFLTYIALVGILNSIQQSKAIKKGNQVREESPDFHMLKCKLMDPDGIISTLAFCRAHSGMLAAGSYSQTTAIYREDNMELLYVLHGQEGGITHVQFSRDGNYLYTGSRRVGFVDKLQRRRRRRLDYTGPAVDDEAVYYKVAGDCPKECVYDLEVVMEKEEKIRRSGC